jgi:arylsulfatase A-like enzyme
VKARSEWHLDGVDLFPFLEGKDAGEPHHSVYWRFGQLKAARVGEWKIVRTWDNQSVELYNLAQDVGEQKDLSADYPSHVKELDSEWSRWNRQLVPPLWPMPETDPPPVKK